MSLLGKVEELQKSVNSLAATSKEVIQQLKDRTTELETKLADAKNHWIPVDSELPKSSINLNLVIVAYFIDGVEHQGSQKIRLAHYHASGAYIGWLPQKEDNKEIEPVGWKVTKWLRVHC